MNSETTLSLPSIDTNRLKHDIEQLIAECTDLKSVLRATWTKPMADEQRRHLAVRRRLTERFVLLAHTRRKQHITHRPRSLPEGEEWNVIEHNTRIAERLAPDYARASEGEGESATTTAAQPEAGR